MASQLLLLGQPRLLDRKGSHIRLPARAYALMAVIAVSIDGFVDRTALAHVLWGDSTTKFGSLRKLLWTIRDIETRADVALIESDEAAVWLAPRDLTVDLALLQALESCRGAMTLHEICRIYRGDLLEGLDLTSSNGNDWLQIQRSRLRSLFLENLTRSIESSVEGNAQIKLATRRLIEIDPYNESACRRLIKLHFQEGEKAQAHKVYQDLARRLRLDLETEPAAETTRILDMGPDEDRDGLRRLMVEPQAASLGMEALPVKSGIPTICLLQPSSAGRSGHLDMIAQSLIDDVTIGLCRSKLLRVLAPYTAWRISDVKLRDQSLLDLHVDYALDSKIQTIGNETKLSFKLFKVISREIVWAEHYAFEPLNAAQRYRDLSVRVMSSVIQEVEREELGRYAKTQDPSAYYWYLIGQRQMAQLDLASIRRGRHALKSALAGAANFVPAISAMARSYQLEWLLLSRGDEGVLAKAEDLAKRAIDLDGQDASGFRELGACNIYLRRFDESLDAYASAEALNPQHADMLADYADALVHASEIPTALIKIKQAIDLNPLCSDRYLWAEAGAHYFSENYQAAIEAVKRMQNRHPALRLLAAAHAMAGQTEAASTCVAQAMDVNPDFQVSRWMDIIPIRRKAQLRHYEYGLRCAGFQ